MRIGSGAYREVSAIFEGPEPVLTIFLQSADARGKKIKMAEETERKPLIVSCENSKVPKLNTLWGDLFKEHKRGFEWGNPNRTSD